MITDIGIYDNGNGGEINLVNNDIQTIKGLTNQVYLALFGGNIEQSTSEGLSELDQRYDWWGNQFIPDNQQFNSNFERTLSQVALNSSGLKTLREAAESDLQYLSDFADITVETSIISSRRLELSVTLAEPDRQSTKVKFIWDGMRNEIIEHQII